MLGLMGGGQSWTQWWMDPSQLSDQRWGKEKCFDMVKSWEDAFNLIRAWCRDSQTFPQGFY